MTPPPSRTIELEREYRAVGRTRSSSSASADERVAQFVRSITEPGALADTAGYSPDLHVRAEGRAARDARRRRAPDARAPSPARAARRAAGAQAHPRGRRVRRAEAAARLPPAPPDGLDPEGARRGRDRRSSTTTGRRSPRPACPTPCASRPSASSARLERDAASGHGESSMIRTYLDWLLAVPWAEALRGAPRSRARPRGARRRPRRSRRREEAHHRVPGRAEAARRARRPRRSSLGRDPDAHRPSGHRQDVHRRVDRRARPGGSSCACRSAACATRPRSAATGAPTSARCPAGWCARSATPAP